MRDKNQDWNFKSNIDHIFDVIRKTAAVIKSCSVDNVNQINGAERYVDLFENYTMHFESSPKQKQFISMQVAEFRKMIRIKRRAYNELYD